MPISTIFQIYPGSQPENRTNMTNRSNDILYDASVTYYDE
jgi:hypothetical protein